MAKRNRARKPKAQATKGAAAGGGGFMAIAQALEEYRESEGYASGEPITYGDFFHVAAQLDNGRNPDSSKAKKSKATAREQESDQAPATTTTVPADKTVNV